MSTAVHATTLPPPSTQQDLLFRKIAWRLLPTVFLCYIVAILDRVNVGFAKLQMMSELGLSAASYGLGAGVFFLAYCLLEVPSNLVMHRVGARLWLTRIMVTWGLITVATAFVSTPTQFYTARAALGAAEAGFYPGVIYFLSQWFPSSRRARALAVFVIAGPVGSMLVGPVAGAILANFNGTLGLQAWQWIFVLTGIPALVMAAVLYAVLQDRPAQASWLSDAEKIELASAMQEEDRAYSSSNAPASLAPPWQAWLAGVSMGTFYLGLYAIVFWTPSILKSAGINAVQTIGWLASLPYLASIVSTLLLGRYADRSGRYRATIAGGALLAAVGLTISAQQQASLPVMLAGLMIGAAFFTAVLPLLWVLAGRLFPTPKSAAAGIALINTVASVGSFLGPYVTGIAQDWTGSPAPALLFIALMACLGGALVGLLPAVRAPRVQ